MSTSIQEQDLIQTIKDLQQRVNDLERQQRTIAGWQITPTALQTGDYNTEDTRYFGEQGLSISDKFKVDDEGNMTATSANVSGTISVPWFGGIDGIILDASGLQVGRPNEPNGRLFKVESDVIALRNYDENGDFDNKVELLWGNNVSDNYYFWISGISSLVTDANQIIMNSKTPASSSATGEPGTICVDANFIYVCVATNTWKRATLNSY